MSDDRQGLLREALENIREICKPMSMTMQGPVWFDGGTPAGGGSRERIWRICDEALAVAQVPALGPSVERGGLHTNDIKREKLSVDHPTQFIHCEECTSLERHEARLAREVAAALPAQEEQLDVAALRDEIVGAMPWYDESNPDYSEVDAILRRALGLSD